MSIANYDRDQGAKDELASAWANIASKEVTAEERDKRLEQLTALATKIIKARSKDRMLGDQKVRLPVHPSQLVEHSLLIPLAIAYAQILNARDLLCWSVAKPTLASAPGQP